MNDPVKEKSQGDIRICDVEGCEEPAVTFHGVMICTHGYCGKHRCCYECGLPINDGCKCLEPKERPEYLAYLENLK